MKEFRKNGKKILALVLKNKKNITAFERLVYKKSNKNLQEYNDMIYQLCHDIENKISLQTLADRFKNEEFLFNHPAFLEIQNLLKEQDEFTVNPFEIEEGVLQCNKCNSQKTFSYTLQTRSSDEATTVFACCAQCGAKWRT
tara:strand:- start:2884 stop:3306 length:423 start_codon:yes stop_codon:yes gene_type:complete